MDITDMRTTDMMRTTKDIAVAAETSMTRRKKKVAAVFCTTTGK